MASRTRCAPEVILRPLQQGAVPPLLPAGGPGHRGRLLLLLLRLLLQRCLRRSRQVAVISEPACPRKVPPWTSFCANALRIASHRIASCPGRRIPGTGKTRGPLQLAEQSCLRPNKPLQGTVESLLMCHAVNLVPLLQPSASTQTLAMGVLRTFTSARASSADWGAFETGKVYWGAAAAYTGMAGGPDGAT